MEIQIMKKMMLMVMIMFQTVIQGDEDDDIDYIEENDDGYDNVLDHDPR